MCIELYINKILVFSKCEIPNTSNLSNITYTNASKSSQNVTFNLNQTANATVHTVNSTQHRTFNYTLIENVTRSQLSLINLTDNITYNNITSPFNMTRVTISPFDPNATPINITVNTTGHLAYNASDLKMTEETTSKVVLQILIPLLVLFSLWGIIILKRRKNKVKSIKMIKNPYYGADVETPESKHDHEDPVDKDPVDKDPVEHKDPDIGN